MKFLLGVKLDWRPKNQQGKNHFHSENLKFSGLQSHIYRAFSHVLLLLLGIGITVHEFLCKPALAEPEIAMTKNYIPTPATDSSLFDEVMDSLDSRFVDVIDKVCRDHKF